MISNTNDGSTAQPYLRYDLNVGTISGVIETSDAPRGDAMAVHLALKEAGFGGVQGGDRTACAALGLGRTWWGRVDAVGDADRIAAEAAGEGYDCVTLHVGTGFEDDAESLRLLAAVVAASDRRKVPLFVETHRATATNDPWRTLQYVRELPELRFNADLSHWYTGAEMHYGDLDRKFDLLKPVFDRVGFIHGRIGSPGCIQVDIGAGGAETDALPFVKHFREMWTRCFAGFLASARPGDYLCFTPELLSADIFYARKFRGPDGVLREEGDRWQQARLYCRVAGECWQAALDRLGK